MPAESGTGTRKLAGGVIAFSLLVPGLTAPLPASGAVVSNLFADFGVSSMSADKLG